MEAIFKVGSAIAVSVCVLLSVQGQTKPSSSEYQIYAGNTHSHTTYTWSHGDQFAKNGCAGILVYSKAPRASVETWSDGYVKGKNGCAGIFVIDGFQYPSPSVTPKPDWEQYQGPPSRHYQLAHENGYDFYVTSDHSQESAFQPVGPENPQWMAAKKQAREATDKDFVAIPAFEYSENDGPDGTGHINVLNSTSMLNALVPGVDLPYFYKWLATAEANGEGPVVASFNHPTAHQYNDWAYRNPQVENIITMLEVINHNNGIHYEGFVNALDHGWKVSPVCGNDNHGLKGITADTSRTFVLATAKTKKGILEAMKNRRTYASMDKNLQARYSMNGSIMGSTLKSPGVLRFDISLNDTNKITKIDIVKDGGAVAQTWQSEAASSVRWTPEISDAAAKYFFVRVWTTSGGDAPVAWLAPVWTGR
jgi:hypothetical protein